MSGERRVDDLKPACGCRSGSADDDAIHDLSSSGDLSSGFVESELMDEELEKNVREHILAESFGSNEIDFDSADEESGFLEPDEVSATGAGST